VTTPSTVLANLYRQGATLRVRGARLGVKAPDGVLTPEIQSALKTHKLQLLELVVLTGEYRKLLRGAFALLLRPGSPSAEECKTFRDEQARVMDELGPELAVAIYMLTAREWRKETGVCPWCDDAGECHEPRDPASAR
jgi:TubC N-terminal docking domain